MEFYPPMNISKKKPKWQSRIDKPETLAILVTQDAGKKMISNRDTIKNQA